MSLPMHTEVVARHVENDQGVIVSTTMSMTIVCLWCQNEDDGDLFDFSWVSLDELQGLDQTQLEEEGMVVALDTVEDQAMHTCCNMFDDRTYRSFILRSRDLLV